MFGGTETAASPRRIALADAVDAILRKHVVRLRPRGMVRVVDRGQQRGIPGRVFEHSVRAAHADVSLEAIFLATFVLLSQNRAAVVADMRGDLDLQIDLLASMKFTQVLRLVAAIGKKRKWRGAMAPNSISWRSASRSERIKEYETSAEEAARAAADGPDDDQGVRSKKTFRASRLGRAVLLASIHDLRNGARPRSDPESSTSLRSRAPGPAARNRGGLRSP